MADQREIDGDVVDPPLGHQHHDSKAEDRGMVLVEARFLGHRMLLASLALERAVADEIEDASSGGGKACNACSANYYSQVFVHHYVAHSKRR